MKRILQLIGFLSLSFSCFSQSLIDSTGKRLYEHHSSAVTGSNFGFGNSPGQSGYDFVNHDYYPSNGYPSGGQSNIDMVEHNGPYGGGGNFGFTSGVSGIWSGSIVGNNTTLWVTAPSSFNYATANDVCELRNIFNAGTSGKTITSVSPNSVYIGKIRNTNMYVAVHCTADSNISSTSGMKSVYFDFDYKYGTIGVGLSSYPDSINTCGNYTWIDSITYTSSNYTATDTLTNKFGCDSVVALYLTISSASRLTSIRDTICEWDSLLFNGNYINTAGNYSDTMQNIHGCDSIITLSLTVDSCRNAGVNENGFTKSAFTIFPNPTNNIINIQSENSYLVTYSIYDITGKLVITENFSKLTTVDVSHFKDGIYTVVLSDINENRIIQKIIVQK